MSKGTYVKKIYKKEKLHRNEIFNRKIKYNINKSQSVIFIGFAYPRESRNLDYNHLPHMICIHVQFSYC